MGDYVELEGVRTWYDDQGVGSPLVLLHGGLMTNESWFAQMPVLSSEWHVYAPERRAHGRTPDVDGPISFDDMATDTIRFLESVVGEPAALVGWSHGGIVGLLVAIARPDLVSKLVVIGTSFDTKGMVFDVDDMVAGMSHDSFEMTMMRETYSAVSPDGADHWPTVFQKITTMWTREPHIPIDDLKKLAVPVLVLVGDDDMVSLSHSVELSVDLLGAPYIERLRGNRSLNAALGAVTAAVVGVSLNLAITFGIAVLFSDVSQSKLLNLTFPDPNFSSIDLFTVALAAIAFCGSLEVQMERAGGSGGKRYRWTDLSHTDLRTPSYGAYGAPPSA